MTHYLQNYANFTNKFDLDKAVTEHTKAHWGQLNKTDLAILNMVRQYSVKYGAAHLKHETIEKSVKKSNATVRRSLRKLSQLGIINRIRYVRPVTNGLGANIYAITPFKKEVQPENKIVQHKTPEVTRSTKPEEIDQPTSLFERMKTLLMSTIGQVRTTRQFFGVYRHLTVPMMKFDIHAGKKELFEQLAIQALHITVRATKRKNINNIVGYYAGVLREMIDEALFGDMFTEYGI